MTAHLTIRNLFAAGFIFFVVIPMFSSCYYDIGEELYPQLQDSCDTTGVTFSADVYPEVQLKCLVCHDAATMSGNINLEGYNNVLVQVQNGKFLGAIKQSAGYIAMPQGGSKLDNCTIEFISAWINAGAPNN